jgi:hypothetical protein
VIPRDYIVFYLLAFLGFSLYFTFQLYALYLEDMYDTGGSIYDVSFCITIDHKAYISILSNHEN